MLQDCLLEQFWVNREHEAPVRRFPLSANEQIAFTREKKNEQIALIATDILELVVANTNK